MKADDVKPYVGKIVMLDFLNGMMPILTQINGVDDAGSVLTGAWLTVVPTQQGVMALPYGSHMGFEMAKSVTKAKLDADQIGIIMEPVEVFRKKYHETSSSFILDMTGMNKAKLLLNE